MLTLFIPIPFICIYITAGLLAALIHLIHLENSELACRDHIDLLAKWYSNYFGIKMKSDDHHPYNNRYV